MSMHLSIPSDLAQPAPSPQVQDTGQVAGDIAELEEIDIAATLVKTVHELPLSEQVSVLADVHSRLQTALTEIDSTSR